MQLPAPRPQLNKKQSKPFVLTSRHDEIIRAVHDYRYVTATDITRLFYSPNSLKHVREILSRLSGGNDYVDRQYLFRFPLPHTHSGNAERIYTLGAKSRSYLQGMGIETNWYLRPSDVVSLTYQHLQHALSLTRFLIAARIFVQKHPEIELPVCLTEYTLRQHAGQVTIEIKKSSSLVQIPMVVVPDAWLDFRFPHTTAPKRPVLLEIDRGTEMQKYFKRHVASRIAFVKPNGEYHRLFGTNFVTIAYATTAGHRRLQNMLTWTEEILTDLGKQNYADVFRFTSLPEQGEYDEEQLFQASSWRQPFENRPVSLLG